MTKWTPKQTIQIRLKIYLEKVKKEYKNNKDINDEI